ncbi:hypothetical protein CHLRE_08g384700v5 [Chlamydomonas reinhardtii]|uniref:Methyltransferase small domain-containing protein n=1 Tax=Chlamydomonas reinhardtii TaxID=3055 RepID=A0A2K3DIA7_CHLRE|nr:uncharacterized protein CHLRE_08g384700v5 [Chlamydomonas reinhardtii]PNW80268.1 hypothetical protein CHLRE_08g384700v5 [Chlamydomonas reinhardtii]
MKLKELHALMQDIAPFRRAKTELEQYPTGPHLASRLLFTVDNSYDEFAGRTVADLGCGTAMLSIGAALLGARHVVGVDIDPDALEVAAENIQEVAGGEEEGLPIDLVLADVRALPLTQPLLQADTVIMNPPFGTKQKGVDMAFLAAAFSVSLHTVYSLHKSSTRDFIAKTAKRDLGAASAEVLAQLRYDLPATMKFHKHKSVDIEVDLWRFEVGAAQQHQHQQAAGACGRRQEREEEDEDQEEEEEDDGEEEEAGGRRRQHVAAAGGLTAAASRAAAMTCAVPTAASLEALARRDGTGRGGRGDSEDEEEEEGEEEDEGEEDED